MLWKITLESCAQVKVDVDSVQRLLRQENLEVSLRYVLKHSTRRGSSSTHQRSRTTLWQAEDDGWRVRIETVHGKRVGKTSGMILSIKELWQKSHRAPTEPYKRRCRSKVRHQPEKTDGRQAKAKLAKEMLRYLDNSEKVKVGIAELQERLEVPVQTSGPAGEE